MGVKVTLLRANGASFNHTSYGPEMRMFKDADEWDFDYDGNISTLQVMRGVNVLYEIPTSNIESVEFV
jgi:hypothetical protein